MRIGEAAARAGVSVKALRYYEALGLVTPARSSNGYRHYNLLDVRMAIEIRCLRQLGRVSQFHATSRSRRALRGRVGRQPAGYVLPAA